MLTICSIALAANCCLASSQCGRSRVALVSTRGRKTFSDQTTGRATVKIDAESFKFVLQAATVMFESPVSRMEELQAASQTAPDPKN